MKFPVWLLLLPVVLAVSPVAGESLEEAFDLQLEADEAARETQARIDELSDDSARMLEAYRLATQRSRRLEAYNAQLERLIASQEEEKVSLRRQIDDVQVVEREIIPHMLDLVADLEAFVARDKPFLPEEREQRISGLQALLDRADISSAEKYRRIMEAYQIEAEFGRTLEAYRGTLADGERHRTVEFLRVGRLALIYRTLDGREMGRWNHDEQRWESLPRRYRGAVDQGLRMARRQAPPDLLVLPVPAPVNVAGPGAESEP